MYTPSPVGALCGSCVRSSGRPSRVREALVRFESTGKCSSIGSADWRANGTAVCDSYACAALYACPHDACVRVSVWYVRLFPPPGAPGRGTRVGRVDIWTQLKVARERRRRCRPHRLRSTLLSNRISCAAEIEAHEKRCLAVTHGRITKLTRSALGAGTPRSSAPAARLCLQPQSNHCGTIACDITRATFVMQRAAMSFAQGTAAGRSPARQGGVSARSIAPCASVRTAPHAQPPRGQLMCVLRVTGGTEGTHRGY